MVSEGISIGESVVVTVIRNNQLDLSGVASIAFVIILIAAFVWLIKKR